MRLSFNPEPTATAAGPACWKPAATLVLLLAAAMGRAGEINSNGTGGGPWSDPATWRGKKVPGPTDDVVIQKHDVVFFDRNDEGKITCQKLQIDPKGGLVFKTRMGKVVCSVADLVESFGGIRLDGTKSPDDFLEMRLLGDKADKRKVKLRKGSALLLYGRDKLPGGRRNVALTANPPADAKKDVIGGLVEAEAGSMIDLLRTQVNDVKIHAASIDNTGGKPHERLNVIDCKFQGQGRLYFISCDTPVIARNTFDSGGKPVTDAAIWVGYTPLAEIKDNTVRGPFGQGIYVYVQGDSVVMGNIVEKCSTGLLSNTSGNTMVRQCTFKGCGNGLYFVNGSGVLENLDIEGAKTAMEIINTRIQASNVQVKELDKKGTALFQQNGEVTLLNCNILPAQVKLGTNPEPAKGAAALVTSLQYLVVGVKNLPADSLVEVRTANPALARDAADLNVRNAFAPLVNGLTPLPRTLMPVIVKSWSLDLKGKLVPAPEYAVKVLGPAAKEGAARPVLKMQTYRPAETAFRAMPNDPVPTLEVSLK